MNGKKNIRRTEIFDNLRWITAGVPVVPAGKHRLCVVMIDPEVVLEQVNINPDNGHYSYFGAGIEL